MTLTLLGILTGAVVATTAIGAAATIFPEREPPLPPPQTAPDYLATIQAPTPTPGPDSETQPAVAATTYVNDDDISRLTQWMHSAAWLPAVSAASGAEPQRLLAVLGNPTVNDSCHGQLGEAIYRMAGAGQLLAPTHLQTQQAVDCINQALEDNPTAADHSNPAGSELIQPITRLLGHQSIAANPFTEQAVTEPSPQNIGYWRTIWPHQQHCRDAVPRLAAEIAANQRAETIVSALEQQFVWLAQCLAQTPADPQPPATIPSP